MAYSNLKLRELELLHMLIDQGSVSGAARSLNMSQPNASKMLKKIESDFGFVLFKRQNGRLYATEDAQLLTDQIERTLLSLHRFHSLTEDIRYLRKGNLIIGSLPLLSRHWLPGVVAGFMQDYPQVNITFRTRSSKKLISWVSEGQLDIALGLLTTKDPFVEMVPLIDIHFVVALPINHPLVKKNIIDITDMEGQDFISLSNLDHFRNDTENLLNENKIKPNIRAECTLPTSALQLTERGIGITIIDHLSAQFHRAEKITFRRFSPETRRCIWMLQPQSRPSSSVAKRFIEVLTKTIEKDQLSNPPDSLFY